MNSRVYTVFFIVLLLAACNDTSTPTVAPATLTPTRAPQTAVASPTTALATATPALTGSACVIGDQAAYVYHPARLTPVNPCTHAVGVVEGERREADGDSHLALKCVNADCNALLTAGNTTNQHGDLVVEFVCVHPVTQADAVQSCAQDAHPFTPTQLPKVGDCVWIDGAGVSDGIHGWGEIHPVGAWGQMVGGCSGVTVRALSLDAEPDDGE
jgi:hypothetical protein